MRRSPQRSAAVADSARVEGHQGLGGSWRAAPVTIPIAPSPTAGDLDRHPWRCRPAQRDDHSERPLLQNAVLGRKGQTARGTGGSADHQSDRNGPALVQAAVSGIAATDEVAVRAALSGAVAVCERAGLTAPPDRNSARQMLSHSGARSKSAFSKAGSDQAAGRKRAKLDIGTTLLSRGSPSRSQTSRSAFASPSINRSL